jgi:hypothetical protein
MNKMEKLRITDQSGGLLNPNRNLLYQMSGISAIILVISYVIITTVYAIGGALPIGGEEWLKHLIGHAAEWWTILGLSVLTDFLLIPVAFALYDTLKEVNRNAMFAGAGFLILFVVLDLAVTWPNYSTLITLSNKYAVATNDAQRAIYTAAANYASAVLSSSLFAVYVILVPSIGILITGLVMLGGTFSKATAYLGVLTGILGIVSVVGPIFISALGRTVIITSILTTIWLFFVGNRLIRLSKL